MLFYTAYRIIVLDVCGSLTPGLFASFSSQLEPVLPNGGIFSSPDILVYAIYQAGCLPSFVAFLTLSTCFTDATCTHIPVVVCLLWDAGRVAGPI